MQQRSGFHEWLVRSACVMALVDHYKLGISKNFQFKLFAVYAPGIWIYSTSFTKVKPYILPRLDIPNKHRTIMLYKATVKWTTFQ